jgi:hypothetical protein
MRSLTATGESERVAPAALAGAPIPA